MGGLWGIITIVGPILLIGAILYAVVRNRGGSRAQVEQAERGAAQLREDIRKDPDYSEE